MSNLAKFIPLLLLLAIPLVIILGSKLFPVLIVIAVIAAIINNFKKYMSDNVINVRPNFNFGGAKNFFYLVLVAIITVLVVAISLVIVPAGETGVVHLFGKVSDEELSSGIHLKNPFAQVTKMSIRTDEYTMSVTQGEGVKISADAIRALTKEGLDVDLDITVLYHLEEEKAADVFKNVGINYAEKIIRPSIRSGIREIIANYEAKDIYSAKRQEAAQEILTKLQETIASRGIVIEDVLLRNVNLPAKLSNAIQEKLTAEQEAQRYEFVLEREEKEADRKRIEAAGQRDAQKIINESLTPNYLQYLYIQELKEREGTIYVPTNPQNGLPMFRGL